MADLAAKMAARRKKMEEEGEDAYYFKSPDSGPRQSAKTANASDAVQVPPPPKGNGQSPIKVPSLSEKTPTKQNGAGRDVIANNPVADPMEQMINDYQKSLIAEDFSKMQSRVSNSSPPKPAQPNVPVARPAPPPPAISSPPLPPAVKNVEADDDEDVLQRQIRAYQMQLRTRDEADAVAGLACGNLDHLVQSRPAPISQTMPVVGAA
eukprot:CAMPEP_0113695576 /NCGR_PEP_ID=MMETSP0038_2-20120614/20986_1 /TAXON_ID=2898 /ORGANISM="Cryptomonas paramecium" /LENGTH=207 /DNA_ID=CAMNT_0000618153 /DNA_START=71 /DNA_END=690 /DNA_ORIENTATION=+ /assembly_acc=CAM_ASM_000170